MYSKNKFYFLNLINHTKKFKNYSKNTQFQKILTIYDDYIKFLGVFLPKFRTLLEFYDKLLKLI